MDQVRTPKEASQKLFRSSQTSSTSPPNLLKKKVSKRSKEERKASNEGTVESLLENGTSQSPKKRRYKKKAKVDDFKLKRWTQEEHQQFLEALKLFGKDWSLVSNHVKTKSTKNIISHAQKFHKRLKSTQAKDKTIPGITLEETEYFLETLSKRLNRSTIEKEKKDAKTADLQQQGFLFRVDKIKRRTRRSKIPEDAVPQGAEEGKIDEPEESKSEYERWRSKNLKPNDYMSFRQSLGWSVKLGSTSTKTALSGVPNASFRDFSDSDSTCTTGRDHIRKFRISDEYGFLREINFKRSRMFQKIISTFAALPDLKSPDEEVDLMVKMGQHLHGPLVAFIPLSALLISRRGVFFSRFKNSYPNLYAHLKKRIEERMDNDEFSQETNLPELLIEKMKALVKPENQRYFVEEMELKFYYKKRNPS